MSKCDDIKREIKKVIHGKDSVIEMTLAAVLAKGHILLEDIPGVGKTTLAVAFSRALGLDYRRMQFTPDVLPSDLIGFNMYDKSTGEFTFREGAVYTNLFLADEINRTSPKTQSALLEVMEEGKATVDGVTRALKNPFVVIATDNPYGSSGTQKLPESQLDRFMICLTMGYPDTMSAINVLKGDSSKTIDTIIPVTSAEELLAMQEAVENLFVDEALYDYIVALSEETRKEDYFSLGLSPRGSIALLKVAKGLAYIKGRDYLIPEDIHNVFLPVLGHRVKLSSKQRAAGKDVDTLLLQILNQIPIPKV
ncbi:MAG TPA: MoxR family ATPase [Lachnospiraceae bacterium]|jgi:MoxR-like ATPase|nr:MoxR family ATPase [Lachnospiraceae bacterium]